jgi:hypothetical protein
MDATPDFLSELDALDNEAAALFALPAERLIKQPAPGKWSALQCIEHLILTNAIYIPAIDQAVREARAKGAGRVRKFSYSPLERFIIKATEPPSRIKVPAPKSTVAAEPPQDVDAIRQAYYDSHMKLQRCITDAMTVDLRKAKVKSQLGWRPSTNAGLTLGVILAHERRHLYQARQAAQ